ncbi:MAG TPA: Maf family nucleotide pyrophosphatase [Hyphomicrobiaceae bacterium]|nr:Maf family nucleotide pyrophosphatase [Hyphomicrobiaceae bacterium]
MAEARSKSSTAPRRLILASASAARRTMLDTAGVDFEVIPANIDERAIEQANDASPPSTVAAILAEAKAIEVSVRHPNAVVIGSDQVLAFDGAILHKAPDLQGARLALGRLAGRTHELHSAAVIASGGRPVWRYVATARLAMHRLSTDEIDAYLGRVGSRVLSSVGCYELEGFGVRLFEAIEGDYFTVLGMPLLPLLGALRERGMLDI